MFGEWVALWWETAFSFHVLSAFNEMKFNSISVQRTQYFYIENQLEVMQQGIGKAFRTLYKIDVAEKNHIFMQKFLLYPFLISGRLSYAKPGNQNL